MEAPGTPVWDHMGPWHAKKADRQAGSQTQGSGGSIDRKLLSLSQHVHANVGDSSNWFKGLVPSPSADAVQKAGLLLLDWAEAARVLGKKAVHNAGEVKAAPWEVKVECDVAPEGRTARPSHPRICCWDGA